MSYRIEDQWANAIEAFSAAQLGRGVASSTVGRRVKHVRRFAFERGGGLSPWHVGLDDVQCWIEACGVAATTRTAMRDSLRAFYRWAVSAGRVQVDPLAELSHKALRLPVPDAWEQPLRAFERHLWARGVSPQTVRTWMDQLRTFARDCPSLEPFSVTVDDLYEWMAGKQWARETRRGRKSLLLVFYDWAVETDRMQTNPAARLPKVKAGDPVARPATDAEYAEALRNAGERWELALRLGAELGLRRGEVARVHSADLTSRDDGAAWLTVLGKGAKVRRVPVSQSLALALRARGDGYVFPGQIVEKQRHAASEGHVSAAYLGKVIARLLPAGVTMHALRHRFATKAYNVNRDVFTVQRLLGHSSPATTQRYVQVSDDTMRALVEAVSA